jgi:hypothetical protein
MTKKGFIQAVALKNGTVISDKMARNLAKRLSQRFVAEAVMAICRSGESQEVYEALWRLIPYWSSFAYVR